ncbi:MAG: hypothetical protein ABIQ39_02450, partial [Ilumatobacteraceae bacterium]
MRKHRIWAPAAVLIATTLGACGSSGGSSASFTDQLQSACRSISQGLRNIDVPKSLDDVAKAATKASAAYEDGLSQMTKLKVPSKQNADFKSLNSNFIDEQGLYDEIAAAAKKGDSATVATKVSSLNKILKEDSDLADSLATRGCALDTVITDTAIGATTTTTIKATTTTVAETTTVPPVTLPPTVAPTVAPTEVPTTASGASNKTIIDFAGKLTPQGDYTFVDAGADKVQAIETAFNLSPLIAAQSGKIIGVDVIVNSIAITRVFAFLPEANTLTAGSTDQLVGVLAGSAALTPQTIGTLSGKAFTSGGNLFFIAEDSG